LAAGDSEGNAAFSYPMFRDLEQLQTVFTGIAAHKRFAANLSFHGDSLSGSGLAVSGSYFPVLGVQPALGRLFGTGDDRVAGESDVVVLSHAYWQRRFGGAVNVLNDTLVVNGRRMTIIGVAARGFDGTTLGRRPDVYVPITMFGHMNPEWRGFDDRRSHWAILFARLRPGVTLDQARAMLDATYRAVISDTEAPLQAGMSDESLAQFKASMLILESGRRGQSIVHRVVRTPLTLLLAVSAVVLLIACVNIANLLLARAATRATEMTVRLSLGASRSRLIAQVLTEACMLAGLGGIAGLLTARVTLSTIASLTPEGPLASAAPTTLDTNVVLCHTLPHDARHGASGTFDDVARGGGPLYQELDTRESCESHRALRRLELYGSAANARNRLTHGTRRDAGSRPPHRLASGGVDDGGRRCAWPGGRGSARARGAGVAVRDQRARPDRVDSRRRGAHHRRADCRSTPGGPCVACRSDACASI
jgi:hypothetical protein